MTLSRPRAAWLTAAAVLAAYALTLAPGMTFYDSPELALVAAELGVGHPVGQPIHTLIGFVFAHLPGVPATLGLTLLSAIAGALCVLPAWSLADALAGPARAGRELWARALPLFGGGLSMIAWEPSTRVEVYSLASLLVLLALARLADPTRRGRGVLAAALLGLAAGAHLVIAAAGVAAALAIALGELRRERELRQERETPELSIPRGAGAFVGTAALSYLYLPLAGARAPETFAWGAPTSLDAFLSYVRGEDYGHNQGIDFPTWAEHLVDLTEWSFAHGTLPVLALGAVGFVALSRRGLRLALPLTATVTVGFVAANVVFHPDVPDYRGYFLAPLWLCLAGVAGLAQVAARHDRYQRYAPLAAALPLLALVVSPTHLLERRDDPSLADVMAHGALEEAPPDAILVVSADHWVAPLLFAQEVEGVRPDVVIVATGLGSSRWYWEHLFARHPGLTPMTLVGPGGRAGRLRRLLQANPERPVLLESIALGEPLGLLPCGVGWMVWTEGACEAGGPEAHVASAAIERTAPLSGEALEVAARVNERRGEALWRFGRARAAARAMMAALPPSGLGRPLPGDLPDRGPPLTGPLPDWSRAAALHDPARNLVFTGLLLRSVGRPGPALQLVDEAAALGLEGAGYARQQITAPP